MLDLAGSEKIYKYETNIKTIKESKNINLSLLNLQKVILALEKKSKGYMKTHVPFRNSALTLFLKDCFEQNSIIRIILTLNLDREHLNETMTTLRFGMRCKNIKIQYIEKEKKKIIKNNSENEKILQQRLDLLEKQLEVYKSMYEEALKELKIYKKPVSPLKLSSKDFDENYINKIVKKVKKYLHNEDKELEINNTEEALLVCETIKMLYKKDHQKIEDTILQINNKMKNYENLHTELKIINDEYLNIEKKDDYEHEEEFFEKMDYDIEDRIVEDSNGIGLKDKITIESNKFDFNRQEKKKKKSFFFGKEKLIKDITKNHLENLRKILK